MYADPLLTPPHRPAAPDPADLRWWVHSTAPSVGGPGSFADISVPQTGSQSDSFKQHELEEEGQEEILCLWAWPES
jgi:hypothetical protein